MDNQKDPIIRVINADSLDEALRLKRQGFKPIVLDMANREFPGGGILSSPISLLFYVSVHFLGSCSPEILQCFACLPMAHTLFFFAFLLVCLWQIVPNCVDYRADGTTQEAGLFLRTNLFQCLDTEPRRSEFYPLPSQGAVYCPNMVVLRKSRQDKNDFMDRPEWMSFLVSYDAIEKGSHGANWKMRD